MESKISAIQEGNKIRAALNATSLDNPLYRKEIISQCETLSKYIGNNIRKQIMTQLEHMTYKIAPVPINESIMEKCIDFLYLHENTNYANVRVKERLEEQCFKIHLEEINSLKKTIKTQHHENDYVDITYRENYRESNLGDIINCKRLLTMKVYDEVESFFVREQKFDAPSAKAGPKSILKRLSFRRNNK